MTRTATIGAAVAVIVAVSIVVEVIATHSGTPAATATNAVAATAAAVVNLWVAVRRTQPGLRNMRAVRGVLATAYAALFWGQIFGALTMAQRVMVGTWIAPTAWVVVWIVPCLVVRIAPTSDEIAGAVVDRLRSGDDE